MTPVSFPPFVECPSHTAAITCRCMTCRAPLCVPSEIFFFEKRGYDNFFSFPANLLPFNSQMDFQLCFLCEEEEGTACRCALMACAKCTMPCQSCEGKICMECSTLCNMCDSALCPSCTYLIDTCKCCKLILPFQEQGETCDTCILSDWFSKSPSHGFRCTACETHCRDDKCMVLTIASTQTECPICFDEFSENETVVQLCQLHRVCKSCEYDTLRGCPICRVGK